MALSVKFLNWQGIAKWKWVVNDECCGICRQAFDAFCNNCKTPGDDCPPVWGKCNHAFHMHCILKWLETQQTCCMCRRPWEFRSEEATEASDENDKEENSNVQEESQDNLDNSEDAPN